MYIRIHILGSFTGNKDTIESNDDIVESDDEVKSKHTVNYESAASEFASIDKDPTEEKIHDIENPKIAATKLPQASKSLGTRQNILILGTARVGKYTIAKYIATDGQDFTPQDSVRGMGEVHCYEHQNYNFILIDTAGAHSESHANEKISISSIKTKIKSYLEHGINLILLVVRKDCCTPEELDSLANIVNTLFNAAAQEYIALVHTGCENLEEKKRSEYIESFRRSEGPAGKLSSLCRKGVCAVGFPELEQVSNSYIQLYQESINISKEALRRLVKDSKCIQPCIELFKTEKTFENPQLFSNSSTYMNCTCILM